MIRGERGYLAREDAWIKSKYPRSNSSIQEIGRVRERKKPRGGGRNESSVAKGSLASGLESILGARIHGAELGTKICGADLGAKICGAEVPAT